MLPRSEQKQPCNRATKPRSRLLARPRLCEAQSAPTGTKPFDHKIGSLHGAYCAPDRNEHNRSRSMRLILLVVLLFGFLAWDLAANNGLYTHMISGDIDDLGRQLGLR